MKLVRILDLPDGTRIVSTIDAEDPQGEVVNGRRILNRRALRFEVIMVELGWFSEDLL